MNRPLHLLIHCLWDKTEQFKPHVNNLLYIDVNELENYLISLKNEGYKFCLPHEVTNKKEKKICVSFDDGQFNNRLFLNIATKHNIPYVLYLSSKFISENEIFPWDKKKLDSHIISDAHRPYSISELNEDMKSGHLSLAPHTHTHTPLTDLNNFEILSDVEVNLEFLRNNFDNFLEDDFAFPNGYYNARILKLLSKKFKRLHSIEGARHSSSSLIHRVSLIDTKVAGSFKDQINRTLTIRFRLARAWVKFKRSYL